VNTHAQGAVYRACGQRSTSMCALSVGRCCVRRSSFSRYHKACDACSVNRAKADSSRELDRKSPGACTATALDPDAKDPMRSDSFVRGKGKAPSEAWAAHALLRGSLLPSWYRRQAALKKRPYVLRCDIRTTVDSWNPMVAQILLRNTVTGGWVHVAAALMDCSPEAQRCVPAG
jgi:hypothetical protein